MRSVWPGGNVDGSFDVHIALAAKPHFAQARRHVKGSGGGAHHDAIEFDDDVRRIDRQLMLAHHKIARIIFDDRGNKQVCRATDDRPLDDARFASRWLNTLPPRFKVDSQLFRCIIKQVVDRTDFFRITVELILYGVIRGHVLIGRFNDGLDGSAGDGAAFDTVKDFVRSAQHTFEDRAIDAVAFEAFFVVIDGDE